MGWNFEQGRFPGVEFFGGTKKTKEDNTMMISVATVMMEKHFVGNDFVTNPILIRIIYTKGWILKDLYINQSMVKSKENDEWLYKPTYCSWFGHLANHYLCCIQPRGKIGWMKLEKMIELPKKCWKAFCNKHGFSAGLFFFEASFSGGKK